MKDEGEDTMNYQHYSPEFKAKLVLQVLQGEKEIGELAQEHSISPNLIRKWKTEFLEKASMVFEDSRKEATKAKRGGAAGEGKAADAQNDWAVDAGAGLHPGCLSPLRAARASV